MVSILDFTGTHWPLDDNDVGVPTVAQAEKMASQILEDAMMSPGEEQWDQQMRAFFDIDSGELMLEYVPVLGSSGREDDEPSAGW